MLAKGLREHTYAVDVATDGETALFRASTTDYDAIVLDVMLPVKDGFAVCRTIRASGSLVPILMVTARDAVEARIEGLDCGADDYLVKPFDFGEAARAAPGSHSPRPPASSAGTARGGTTRARHAQPPRHVEPGRGAHRKNMRCWNISRRAGDVVNRRHRGEHCGTNADPPLSNVVVCLHAAAAAARSRRVRSVIRRGAANISSWRSQGES